MSALGGVALGVAVASLGLAALAPAALPARLVHPDASALALVRPTWSMERWELLRAAVTVSAAILASPSGAWPAVIVAGLAPSILVRHQAGRLRERSSARAVDVLRGTHAAMRSGMPLVPALRHALERVEPLDRAPFEGAVRAFELNAGLDESLAAARRRAADRRVALALDALALLASEELPASRGAALLASVADRLSFEQRLVEEVRARTGGVRAQIVILALLVPGLALYLGATMPGLAATLATPLGRFVLIPCAVVLELAGVVASRAIVRDVLR